MDSYFYNFRFPECRAHAYTRVENGCIENSIQKLLTKYSMEEKKTRYLGKNYALGLEYVPRPADSGRILHLWHNFSQYGPHAQQITCIYYTLNAWSRGKQVVFPRVLMLGLEGKRN